MDVFLFIKPISLMFNKNSFPMQITGIDKEKEGEEQKTNTEDTRIRTLLN